MYTEKRYETICAHLTKLTEAVDGMRESVIDMMREANMTFISFAALEECRPLSVDTAFAAVMGEEGIDYGRVLAVYCDIREEKPDIYITTDGVRDRDLVNTLVNCKVAYTPCEEVAEIVDDYGHEFFEEMGVYNRPYALSGIMSAVAGVLDMLPTDRLKDGETFDVPPEKE